MLLCEARVSVFWFSAGLVSPLQETLLPLLSEKTMEITGKEELATRIRYVQNHQD